MTKSAPLNSSVLQDFLVDAQVLLTQSQECLQHLELIGNDPDACHCLNATLGTLAQRASTLGLIEVADYAGGLQALLNPAGLQQQLHADALPALEACLTLLAWQLELIDPLTGRLSLDTEEQTLLLTDLANALGLPSPLTCASCHANGSNCVHPPTSQPPTKHAADSILVRPNHEN
ncbi:histidine kinase [Pseudomonas sp. X10]